VETAVPGPGTACNGAIAVVGTGKSKSLTEGNVVLNATRCGTSYQMIDRTRGGGATHNMSMKTAGMGTVFTDADNTWNTLGKASLVCNGNTTLAGIGRAAAQKIWYRALTVYMTSGTNYAGARAAAIRASTDLYGAASAQTNAVKAAWSAVSVN
jgi:Zn-dependent metalloprotease